ncbi:MAG: hypothetical protein R3A10_23510 [Caldilineaceae bacterium]
MGVTSVQPQKTEPELMVKCIQLVQALTDVPLCIDSRWCPRSSPASRPPRGVRLSTA